MISVTKKQASLALVVVAFATIMIAGTIAASTGSVFAWRDRHHSDHFNNFELITLTTPNTTAKDLTLTKA